MEKTKEIFMHLSFDWVILVVQFTPQIHLHKYYTTYTQDYLLKHFIIVKLLKYEWKQIINICKLTKKACCWAVILGWVRDADEAGWQCQWSLWDSSPDWLVWAGSGGGFPLKKTLVLLNRTFSQIRKDHVFIPCYSTQHDAIASDVVSLLKTGDKAKTEP